MPSAASAKIGLIGGLALRAGIFYYETIVRRSAPGTPRLTLTHADVTRVVEWVAAGDRAALGAYLGGLANQRFDGGATLVAITAVAPHIAIDEIRRVARGPVVSVLDCIAGGMAAAGLDRVGVFGNRAVMESGIFGTLDQADVVRLDPAELDRVHAAYTDIALHGKRGTEPETALLADTAAALAERGAQSVLLAGTDLSSFYAEVPPSFPALDVAGLHIDAILKAAAPANGALASVGCDALWHCTNPGRRRWAV